MSFLSRLIYGSLSKSHLPARFGASTLERQRRFNFGIGEISTKMYIAEWYLSNFIVTNGKNFKMQSELEHLTRSFNGHYARRIFINLMCFIGAVYTYEQVVYEKPLADWQDNHDPKFDSKLYGDLEEGGDEGGDDD